MADTTFGTSAEPLTNAAESSRNAAAGGIQDTAESIRSVADRLPGGKVRDFAKSTAGKLDSAAGYLRDRDAADILDDIREQARANPVPFLVGAIALGFVFGRLLRRH